MGGIASMGDAGRVGQRRDPGRLAGRAGPLSPIVRGEGAGFGLHYADGRLARSPIRRLRVSGMGRAFTPASAR